MRTAIHVRCDNQVLSYVEMPFIASGDVNEDKIEFEFCPMWEGFTKTAVFYRTESDVYHVLLEEDDACIIPHEVLADPGPLYFGVFGTREDRVRTSEIIQYTIKQGAITEATKISDPTPNIYSQILAACEEAVEIAKTVKREAESGIYAGKSAYQSAVEGGYEGTEEEFGQALATLAIEGSALSQLEKMIDESEVLEGAY